MILYFIIFGIMFYMIITSLIQAARSDDFWQTLIDLHPFHLIAEDIEEYKRKSGWKGPSARKSEGAMTE